MPVTNYRTVNGRMIGETTDGVRTDYLTDALGSVTATVDQSQNVLNTYRYKPYGGLLAKTGSSPDPKFLWTGDTGSRTTGLAYSEQYNRARHYGSRQANWTSVDPLWPGESDYGYCKSNPLSKFDPNGLDDIDDGPFRLPSCFGYQTPSFPLGPLRFSVSAQICFSCYDASCCPPGNWSGECRSLAVYGSLSFGISWRDIDKWLKVLSPRGLTDTYESILRVISGLAFGVNQCLSPEKTCVPKSTRTSFDLCVRGCLGFVSVGCCAPLSGLSQWKCSGALGYCGLPSISWRLRWRHKECD
ncbi:MAG: hypothetical protein KIS66_18055 [Fimbriimonadaceae bacterium]|nr:hypothetical protein [Fimbriimonadaceae bacterium]